MKLGNLSRRSEIADALHPKQAGTLVDLFWEGQGQEDIEMRGESPSVVLIRLLQGKWFERGKWSEVVVWVMGEFGVRGREECSFKIVEFVHLNSNGR